MITGRLVRALARCIAGSLLVTALSAPVFAQADAEPPIVRLTTTGARNGQAFWSSDGKAAAFVSNRSGSWQVWLMPVEGGDARQLTQAVRPVGWPSWTPDGAALLYYEGTVNGYRLFRLTVATGQVEPVFHEANSDFRPSLSPDGTRLLFDRAGHAQPGNHDLFVRNLRDGSLRQLTQSPSYDSDARWSPDGQHIVWQSDRGASTKFHTQIFSSDAEGGDVRQLTHGPGKAGYPTWSPDGGQIAFTMEIDGNRDIWLMNADGSGQRRLTTDPGVDGEPEWSPTGDKLLISTGRFGGQELAILDLKPDRRSGSGN